MKKQIFINNEYQYDYIKNKTIHTLFYASVEFWADHVQNTIALKIKDDGDKLSIVSPFNKNNIDYAVAEQLEIILRIINTSNDKYEIAEKISL